MKVINFHIWTRRETALNISHTQTREYSYMNIELFGFWWKKAVTWQKIVDEFG